ncbi:MAG: DUF4383 domain-containing protein [Betaproteobacteria bacterium]|nr:MAG: DUF4383 domain-containing protein [Betaproteobacteria bacterium]TMH69576.1 MAG: DUF4383 domain-containing protein [Betaproteobacteria bacterium]
MLKNIAIAFGIVFIIVGILGFVSAVTPNGLLLGYFEVNPAHNVVHLATGVVALIVAFASEKAMRLFFQIFGVIYALVALMGFFMGNQPLLGIVAINAADNWLHVLIAIVALYLGFGMKAAEPAAATTT